MRISLTIYVLLNVTKFDCHFFVWENAIFSHVSLNSLYYCSDVSITVSVITTFFEVFRLFKFVTKLRCTENYIELHETNDIYENLINQGLIWNLFCYMSTREILRDMYLNLARSKFWDCFTKYFWTIQNCIKITISETCLMIYTDSVESLLSFATISILIIDQFLTPRVHDGSFSLWSNILIFSSCLQTLHDELPFRIHYITSVNNTIKV